MTFTQISYFLTLADVGSFSAAAERLYVSQPAVSKQIALLERDLGFKLFNREDRQIWLTSEGELVRECFQRCEEDVRRTLDEIHRRGAEEKEVLRLGCVGQWNASKFISPVLEHFEETYPQVQITLEAFILKDIIPALQQGEVDMALAHSFFFANRSDMYSVRVKELRCGVLYSPAHFMPHGEGGLRDFGEAPLLISGEMPVSLQRMIREIGDRYGVGDRRKYYSREASTVMGAACGQGVMVTSEWHSGNGTEGLSFLPLGREMPVSIGCMAEDCDSRKREAMKRIAEILKEEK
ncbi:MAG: LysR family transcriptional regulator [Oscillospiraceae bacterium]